MIRWFGSEFFFHKSLLKESGTHFLLALFFILTFGLKRYVFTKVGLEGKIPAIDQFGGDKNKNLLNELVVVPHPVGSKALIRLKTPGEDVKAVPGIYGIVVFLRDDLR